MSDRLPPLTALRAFEAAARHMSFAKAADELHVTPAALSFQIKSLEEHLGQPVFHRLNRAVELTEIGALLAPGMQNGFSEIASAWRRARRFADQSILTVTAGPAFTALWLAPRLFSFATEHPEIELRFSASLRLVDFDRDDVDLAIRFGPRPADSLFSRALAAEWATPMMAPALAERVKTPADLAKIPLLTDDVSEAIRPSIGWDEWLAAAGHPPIETHGARFNQADHAVSAAIAGTGAIMGRGSLTEAALREGRLVMPFKLSLQTASKYRLVCPHGVETRPHVAAFMDWIDAQAASLDDLANGRVFADPETSNGGD
ncbi:MAG: transcriptional regulator GcvA [Pseudomonadota bacterium]